ncbi:hypothetical protein [Aeromonas diversa]|uniref:hypothetical protein n=1 Tax=Aeromonas diversa TaxID=502790 RepID=UPI0034630595
MAERVALPSWRWAPWWLLLGLIAQWLSAWLNYHNVSLLVVLLLAMWFAIALQSAPQLCVSPGIIALTAPLLLIPSATLRAIATLLMLASLFPRAKRRERAMLVIALAFTLAVLWGHQLFGLLSGWLLTLDARGVALWLDLLGVAPQIEGNRVARAGGHTLVVLKGCSSFAQLYLVVIAWLVARLWFDNRTPRAELGRLLLCLLIYLGANQLRLLLMSLDLGWYRLLHTGGLAQLYQWSVMMGILLLLFLPPGRRGRP